MTHIAFDRRNQLVKRTSGVAAMIAALAVSTAAVNAQSGSVGGAIGKEDKSISGTQAPARSLPTQQPAGPKTPRRASAGSGGGGGSFDGIWTFVGVSSGNCGGTVTLTISGGRTAGEGFSGTVSSNGVINVVGAANGISGVSTGRLSARGGSGTWQQSDGCTSRWTAMKQ